jgi:co-chaperonin GroES (HSP10)
MTVTPLRDNVYIQADEDSKKTSSGILLSREWDKLPHTGKVLAVGSGVKDIVPGLHVRFNRYAFEKIGDREFIGMEKNIVAILDDLVEV